MRRFIAAVLLLSASVNAYAGQEGRILSDDAPVYERSSESSAVLARLARGQVVRLSEGSRGGWYRVRLPTPVGASEYGWILTKDAAPDTNARDLKIAGISSVETPVRSSRRNEFVLYGFYGVQAPAPSDVISLSGAQSSLSIGTGLGGELGYRLSTIWTAGVRVETHSFTKTGNTVEQYAAKGLLIAAMIEKSYVHSLPWKAGIAFGAGASLGTSVIVTSGATTLATPLPAKTVPAALGKLTLSWYPLDSLALNLEVGYRYLHGTKISAPFGGGGVIIEF